MKTSVTLEKYIFISSYFYDFLFFFILMLYDFFFTMKNVFFREFVFDFTKPCTFSEIIKALVLVEHLSTTGF